MTNRFFTSAAQGKIPTNLRETHDLVIKPLNAQIELLRKASNFGNKPANIAAVQCLEACANTINSIVNGVQTTINPELDDNKTLDSNSASLHSFGHF